MQNPFTPGLTVTLPATATTSNVALAAGPSGQVMITNAPDSAVAFIAFGDSTVEAALANSTPILPSAAYMFSIGSATHMAAICAGAGTATVYATRGNGN